MLGLAETSEGGGGAELWAATLSPGRQGLRALLDRRKPLEDMTCSGRSFVKGMDLSYQETFTVQL